MKVKVKAPFFDERGIHKTGEIVDVKEINPIYHEPIVEEKKVKKEEKVETAVEKAPRKTIRKKV